METQNTVKLDSIDAYNKLYGLPTLHPLVTVIDLKKANKQIDRLRLDYGVYALFLKNNVSCSIKYGREYYDYQEGTIVSFSPGQVIDVDSTGQPPTPDVVGLMFHPDLICGTPLAAKMPQFGFFDYSQCESLHLSMPERSLFLDSLDKIDRELKHPVDKHSADLLSANIQLLLEYLHRFYDRQFITRHHVNSSVVANFEKSLKDCFAGGRLLDEVPKVADFADMANLSPGYFGDLIKRLTGKTAQEHIRMRLVDAAKERIANPAQSIAQVAYDLGFKYPAHFSRLFKREVGCTPNQYRLRLG